MHTVDELKSWVEANKDELKKLFVEEKTIPEQFKDGENRTINEVYYTGCWLILKLRELGATEEEIQRLCFPHGQHSFISDPYEVTVRYVNAFEGQV